MASGVAGDFTSIANSDVLIRNTVFKTNQAIGGPKAS